MKNNILKISFLFISTILLSSSILFSQEIKTNKLSNKQVYTIESEYTKYTIVFDKASTYNKLEKLNFRKLHSNNENTLSVWEEFNNANKKTDDIFIYIYLNMIIAQYESFNSSTLFADNNLLCRENVFHITIEEDNMEMYFRYMYNKEWYLLVFKTPLLKETFFDKKLYIIKQ